MKINIWVQNNIYGDHVRLGDIRLPATAPTRRNGAAWWTAVGTVVIALFAAVAYFHPPTSRQADMHLSETTVAESAARRAVISLREQIIREATNAAIRDMSIETQVMRLEMERSSTAGRLATAR